MIRSSRKLLGLIAFVGLFALSGRAAVAQTATLDVRTFYEPGIAAGTGIEVSVQGVVAGVTQADGTLVLSHSPGELVVEAREAGVGAGTATVQADAGMTTVVHVMLRSESALAERATLSLEEIVDGSLPATTDSLTFRFTDDTDQTVILSDLDSVTFSERGGLGLTLLTDQFTAQPDGRISANETQFVVDLVAYLADYEVDTFQFEILGEDAGGRLYSGAVAAPEPDAGLTLVAGALMLWGMGHRAAVGRWLGRTRPRFGIMSTRSRNIGFSAK